MRRTGSLYGSLMWCGTHKNMPAVVGSYNNGASLYVFKDGEWYEYARGINDRAVTPRECSECDTPLPLEDR